MLPHRAEVCSGTGLHLLFEIEDGFDQGACVRESGNLALATELVGAGRLEPEIEETRLGRQDFRRVEEDRVGALRLIVRI